MAPRFQPVAKIVEAQCMEVVWNDEFVRISASSKARDRNRIHEKVSMEVFPLPFG